MKTTTFSFAIASLLVISTAALAGCGTYRVVKRTPNGGEVALQGTPDSAREEAYGYMASQCPSGFDVLEEGEAVVGTETDARTTREKSIFGMPTQNTRSSTKDVHEWRIKYQCKGTSGEALAGRQGRVQELVVQF